MNKTPVNRCQAVFAACVLALASSAVSAEPAPPPPGFQHFITRQGDRLMEGDKEFRFIGANMPGLVLPYDYTLFLPERMKLPTPWEQEDGLKTLDQMNLRVVRTWNLPIRAPGKEPEPWHYVLGPGQFNEESFQVVDSLFALANKYGVHVIFDLTADAGDYLGGIGAYAAHRGKNRHEFYTDPQVKEDYKATLRYVLGRTNSVTGVPYRDDKAILAWQFGNEMNGAPPEWIAEMAAYIKGLDGNHLVADARHVSGEPLLEDPNIDLYTRHYYGGNPDDWLADIRRQVGSLKGQRPFFVGEFGPYVDGSNFTPDNVAGRVRQFLDGVRGQRGAAGALLWSMYFHHGQGGFSWHQVFTYPSVWSYHWPGFPSADAQGEIGIMSAMREAAFKIQGLPVPPPPIPDPPELLAAGNVPMFSWRGSAGASGYDIERAPAADGPWTRIAENVSDADVAYRPLFSDTTARAGESWFYRARAHNVSGMSLPSNVIGPLDVKRVCLADELQDFSRVHSKSDGLQLRNDFNALYAEHLFRAQGGANDWVIYHLPSPIESVKVVAFYAAEGSEIAFQVSADGAAFRSLDPARKERRLGSPMSGPARGQRRTMVEYECAAPPGNRYLRLLWTGPAELDRVEIYHPGFGQADR